MNRNFFILVFAVFFSCKSNIEKLPILGPITVDTVVENGKTIQIERQHTVKSYTLINVDGHNFNIEKLGAKIYIADFFFTNCPTICPKMKAQMLRLYKEFEKENRISFVSHSIDPEHDTPKVLKEYAQNLGVNTNKWFFLTGDKDEIYKIGNKNYMVAAKEDAEADGGFIHSGAFTLVDKKRHIRGFYDGTNPKEVDKLIDDIEKLLDE